MYTEFPLSRRPLDYNPGTGYETGVWDLHCALGLGFSLGLGFRVSVGVGAGFGTFQSFQTLDDS